MSDETTTGSNADLFAALMAPFEPDEVKVRTQAGRQLQYVTARTVMNRLDEVLGPENWWDEFLPMEHSVICKLSVRLPDGTVLTKSDAGGYAGMADQGDDDKSGYSDSFKRAAVKFGVSRYLYRDGIPPFARQILQAKNLPTGGLAPDSRPAPSAPPPDDRQRGREEVNRQFSPSGNGPGRDDEPRTGRALYSWAKKIDEGDPTVKLIERINAWGKRHDLAPRMVDWTTEQVAEAVAVARRAIGALADDPPPDPAPQASRPTAAPARRAEPAPGVEDGDDIPF